MDGEGLRVRAQDRCGGRQRSTQGDQRLSQIGARQFSVDFIPQHSGDTVAFMCFVRTRRKISKQPAGLARSDRNVGSCGILQAQATQQLQSSMRPSALPVVVVFGSRGPRGSVL